MLPHSNFKCVDYLLVILLDPDEGIDYSESLLVQIESIKIEMCQIFTSKRL